MSSTSRGAVRASHDYYRTPAYAVDAILPHLREPRTWLDPGCGDGAIAERVLRHWPETRGIGVEIDEGRAQAARRLPFSVHQEDFLAPLQGRQNSIDLVIGNPPYSFVLEFVMRAIELVSLRGGEVAYLLRTGWLEAKRDSDRDRVLEVCKPDVYLLAKRPRFTSEGGDSATYAWLVWGPGRGTRFVRLRAPAAAR